MDKELFNPQYSKRFLENYRAEITLHKAAKAAFNEANLKKLPLSLIHISEPTRPY